MKDQRRLYVSMIVSLDGYIEGPNRELDWFTENEAFDRYCHEMLDSVGVALYGRRAYDLMIQCWPDKTDDFGRKMNALPKVVLSRTLTDPTWSNTTVVTEVDAIAALKQQPGKSIVAWAGASLVATLRQADLIDEYRVLVHPVVLGGGTPLFQDVTARLAMRLVRTEHLDGGIAILTYEPRRP